MGFFSPTVVQPVAAQPTIGSGTQQGVLGYGSGAGGGVLAGLGYNGPNRTISPYTNPNLGSAFGNPFSDPNSAMQFMLQMAQGGGAATPVSALPAWQAMVQAQNRNISTGSTNLADQFNVSGGRFSTDFGNAATDYMTQATANQNALLGQMQLPALLQSQQLSAGAGMQLPGSMLGAGQAQFGDWMQQLGGLSGIANQYPPMYNPGFGPSGFSQLMGGLGTLGGLFKNLFGGGSSPSGGGGGGSSSTGGLGGGGGMGAPFPTPGQAGFDPNAGWLPSSDPTSGPTSWGGGGTPVVTSTFTPDIGSLGNNVAPIDAGGGGGGSSVSQDQVRQYLMSMGY